MDTLKIGRGAAGQKYCKRDAIDMCMFRRLSAPGEEEPFHHFPLPTQPNCRGDVIFPVGRSMDFRSVLRCKIIAKFTNLQDKSVGFYYTLSALSLVRHHAGDAGVVGAVA